MDHRMSLWQRLLLRLGLTAMSYPPNCLLCGGPRRGNWLWGYRLHHFWRCRDD